MILQVSIGHIVPNGAAALDGRLQPGDEFIFIDNICVLGSSHHRVVELMAEAGQTGQVTLGVCRRKGGSSVTGKGVKVIANSIAGVAQSLLIILLSECVWVPIRKVVLLKS